MDSISALIRDKEIRRRAPRRRIVRIVAGWVTLVATALLCANVRRYRVITAPVPNQDSIAEAAA